MKITMTNVNGTTWERDATEEEILNMAELGHEESIAIVEGAPGEIENELPDPEDGAPPDTTGGGETPEGGEDGGEDTAAGFDRI